MRRNEFELTVAYEPAEAGWFTATIPGMPGVITAGRSKGDARDNVLDALRTMLATPGSDLRDRDVETVRVVLEPTRDGHIGRRR